MKTILVAGGVSLLLALLGTPLAIRVFTRRGYGQLIREEGPAAHVTKRGTPTMGGTVIVIASVVGYFVGNLATGQTPQASGLLVMMLMAGLGLVGFIDDFIKIYKQRSLGLRSSAKLAGQAVVGAVFALLVLQQRFADGYDLTPADAHLSFLRDFGPALGLAPFVLWIVFLIAGTSNAVNLTDGLDGLATGCACLVLAAYVLIGVWQERNDCTLNLAPRCYPVRDPLDLAVVAAAVLAACFGFLWWNAPPARIFMGDTGSLALGGVLAAYVLIGVWQERNDCISFISSRCYQVRDPLDLAVVASAILGAVFGFLWWNAPPAKIFMGDCGALALGGALAGLAICTKTQLLLVILGGLFVIITMSDVIQVTVFKVTRIRTGQGKRVFKMAPLQHHFELLGWSDTTIVIRFWLISGLCVALGLAIFYTAGPQI